MGVAVTKQSELPDYSLKILILCSIRGKKSCTSKLLFANFFNVFKTEKKEHVLVGKINMDSM